VRICDIFFFCSLLRSVQKHLPRLNCFARLDGYFGYTEVKNDFPIWRNWCENIWLSRDLA
jgi:hypothetical protein